MSWVSAFGGLRRGGQVRGAAGSSLVLGILAAALGAVLFVLWLHGNSTESLLLAPLVCWLLPIAAFGRGMLGHSTDTLDTRNLTPHAVRPARAATVTLAAGFVHPSALLALVPYLALAISLAGPLPVRGAVALLGWAGCVLAHRFGVRVGRAVIARRINREVGAVFWYVIWLVAAVVVFGLLFLPWQQAVDEANEVIVAVLEWIPAANLALTAAAAQAPLTLIMNGVLVLALLVLEWVLANRDGGRALFARTSGGNVNLGIMRAAPANATWAIASRTWLSWLRDSRYRLMLITVAVLPPLLVIPVWIAGVGHETLLLLPVPMFALLFGWALHNDTAYDSTALWLHVTGGLRGQADRLGRAVPTLVTGTVLVLLGSVLVWWMGESVQAAQLVALVSLALLGAGVGGSSIMSALAPYPVARPGDSPWSQPVSTWGGSFAVHGISLLVEIVLCLPAIWLAVTALQSGSWGAVWLASGVALVTGAGLTAVGIILGGRVFTARRTKLLNHAIIDG